MALVQDKKPLSAERGETGPERFVETSSAPQVAQSRELHSVLRGASTPLGGLGESVRVRMEGAFGSDLSHVQLYQLERPAPEVGFRAATLANAVFLARGQPRPGWPDGDRLLAHELAHVVQQRAEPGGSRSQKWDRAASEREADRSAPLALQGEVVDIRCQAPTGAVQFEQEGGNESDPPTVTGYVGVNVGAEKELRTLQKALKRVKNHKVMAVLDDPGLEGKSGVLKVEQYKEAGIDIYAEGAEAILVNQGIGISVLDKRFLPMVKWLADKTAKDQQAGLCKLFFDADRGLYKLERLVLSGHSGGELIWGEQETSGAISTYTSMRQMADWFPKAASDVEDIMISGCFSYSQDKVDLYLSWFPNLQSVWAYVGFSPSAKSGGSLEHIKNWEKRTRGHDPKKIKRKGSSVAVWTRNQGALPTEPDGTVQLPRMPNIDLLMAAAAGFRDDSLPGLMACKVEPEDKGALRSFYRDCQLLLVHPKTPESTKPEWDRLRKVALRLRKWPHVVENFAKQHADLIRETAPWDPDNAVEWFAELPRTQLVSIMERMTALIQRVLAGTETERVPPNPATWAEKMGTLMDLMDRGLKQLQPSLIPEDWCG